MSDSVGGVSGGNPVHLNPSFKQKAANAGKAFGRVVFVFAANRLIDFTSTRFGKRHYLSYSKPKQKPLQDYDIKKTPAKSQVNSKYRKPAAKPSQTPAQTWASKSNAPVNILNIPAQRSGVIYVQNLQPVQITYGNQLPHPGIFR